MHCNPFKKFIFPVLVAALLTVSLCRIPSFAKSPTMTYRNGTFHGSSEQMPASMDLFDHFKGVMPGDTLTQAITLKNEDSHEVQLFLRSLGAAPESEALLRQMTLTVVNVDGTQLYRGPASASGQLSSWIRLNSFHPGESQALTLSLEVPATLGNEFQNASGTINWEFKAEDLQGDLDGPAPTTGDPMQPMLWIFTGSMSLILLSLILWRRYLVRQR